VKDLIVRSVVVGAAELGRGMLDDFIFREENAIHELLGFVERVKRVVQVNFDLCRFAQLCNVRAVCCLYVTERDAWTFQAQRIVSEIQAFHLKCAIEQPWVSGRSVQELPSGIKFLVSVSKRCTQSKDAIFVFLAERVREALGVRSLDEEKS
jgi:hypothetical protein